MNGLSASRLADLFDAMQAIRSTIMEAQADAGRMPTEDLLPYREKSAHWPHCRRWITTIKLCSRTGYLCPSCEPFAGGDRRYTSAVGPGSGTGRQDTP